MLHESLHAGVTEDPSIVEDTNVIARDNKFPPRSYQHPVVLVSGPGDVVIPYSLHIDAAPYTKVDGVLVVSAYTTLTKKRHTLAVLRKKEQCKCGCKGHCRQQQLDSALQEGTMVKIGDLVNQCALPGQVLLSLLSPAACT